MSTGQLYGLDDTRLSIDVKMVYRLRKMRRSLKATNFYQFKALLKPKTLCGRAYRTGVGENSHMKSCAASVDNVPQLDCKRRHKQHILCIAALNVRK